MMYGTWCKKCEVCSRHQSAPCKLPIMQPDMPTGPWGKIGTDIFQYEEKHLMIVDYFSRYFVVKKLSNMSAQTVCSKFSEVLTEFGKPTTTMADFGTQYTSEEFKEKWRSMNINITYSSPYHHQTNSMAETVKSSQAAMEEVITRRSIKKQHYACTE